MNKLFTIFLALIGYLSVDAQIFNMLDEDVYRGRVKLVSEFISRFNGEETNPLIDNTAPDKEKINLCQLFDIDMILKDRTSHEKDAFELIDSIMTNNVKLHYNDCDWFAKVTCVGTFKGKEINFKLYLTVEPRGNDMYKWVISGVEGKIFNLESSRISDKIMLLPNEHESNFMRLNSITEEKDDYITLYSSKYNPTNALSVFNTLVYYGYLNIEYVSNIEYCFLQVPGYIFTIKEFDRESSNTGWLITEWNKISQTGKNILLNNLYNYKYDEVISSRANTSNSDVKSEHISEEVAIDMINKFISSINEYLNDKTTTNMKKVDDCVKGRFTFTISDSLSEELCKLNGSKIQKSYRLSVFLDWLSNSKSPFTSLKISDTEPFNNELVNKEYSDGYILISALLTAEGTNSSLQEKVVFFIYENQIAGIKLISKCF